MPVAPSKKTFAHGIRMGDRWRAQFALPGMVPEYAMDGEIPRDFDTEEEAAAVALALLRQRMEGASQPPDKDSMAGDSEFSRWRNLMGLKVSDAARILGFGTTKATALNQGTQELSTVDRYAMAAIRAGLMPWTPETNEQCESVFEFLKEEARPPRMHSAPLADDSIIQPGSVVRVQTVKDDAGADRLVVSVVVEKDVAEPFIVDAGAAGPALDLKALVGRMIEDYRGDAPSAAKLLRKS